MRMQALLLSAEVGEISMFDMTTGAYAPGFGVSAKVVDVEAGETYTCQITDGLAGLDDLKAARKAKQPIDVMKQVAASVEAQLPPAMTQMVLNVKKVKASKGFMTLSCVVESIA